MWHEARKQEKKIRGMLVDYRKRAERRQDFYERIKADPTQFLQVHGRKCKIHLDASVATAAENPAIMMPWQGQKDNLIDRFDVRAHLDYIPPVPRTNPDQPDQHEDDTDERAMNYERYRVLAQNEFLGIVEEKYLHQLYLEEQFGVNAQIEAETKAAAAAAKKKSSAGAAIGYTYEETETLPGGSGSSVTSGGLSSTSTAVPFAQSISAIEKASEASASISGTSGPTPAARFDECMKDDSDSDLDMDVSIDINKIGTTQAHELNTCGRQYGMKSNDFYSFLTKDADEADALRMAREEEQEKIMFSGRKSRRERRAQRERKVAGRPLSPPSYAAKEELVPRTFVEANDSSRSPSPVNSGKITYITSFGGEEELQPHGKISFGFNRDMSTLGGIAAGTSKAARLRAGSATGSGAGADGGGGGIVPLSYADKEKKLPPIVVPHTILGALPPPPPPPPPLPTVDREEKKPVPALVTLIEPEPEVPIKRYYGRRRGDESSSDEASTSGDETNGGDTDRKPNVTSLLSAADPPSGAGGDDPADTTGSTGSIIKSSGTFDVVQIKQEKLDPIAAEPPSAGDSASLRFGKTVTGGTNAPESKIGTGASSAGVAPGPAASSKSFNPRDRLKRKMQIQLNKQCEFVLAKMKQSKIILHLPTGHKADKKAEIEKVERQIQQQQERDDEMRELALKLRRRQRELRHKYGTPESEHSKSHSSEEHSSDEGADAGSKAPLQQTQQQQQQPQQHRFGQSHSPGDDDGSSSPRIAPLLVPPLTLVPPPKMALHTRPPPTLSASGPPINTGGGTGYGNSVVIERKPMLRSATNSSSGQSGNQSPQVPFGGIDIGRLRRRDSPAQSARGYGSGTSSGVGSPSMNLRRGGAMTPSRQTGPSGTTGSRFDDRNRRRSPPSSRVGVEVAGVITVDPGVITTGIKVEVMVVGKPNTNQVSVVAVIVAEDHVPDHGGVDRVRPSGQQREGTVVEAWVLPHARQTVPRNR
uniref:Suppressor of white apricot N-terminal domain-containing protein n=1 Tax=Anopheles farauti TaxID=69004 RepID=A0A182Q3H7_9DIPT